MKTLFSLLMGAFFSMLLFFLLKGAMLYVFVLQLNYDSSHLEQNPTIQEFIRTSGILSFAIGFGFTYYLTKKIKIINSGKIFNYYVAQWHINELLRPWKIITFIIGTLILIIGSLLVKLPDWDIPVSILMVLLTYLLGPLSLNFLLTPNNTINIYIRVLVFIACYIFTVDVSYTLYHEYHNHMYFRLYNLLASTILYFICSFVWAFQGTLKDFFSELRLIKFGRKTI